ncbi:MAG: STAS domain-containing protein [Lachnospiraceae bacterium]
MTINKEVNGSKLNITLVGRLDTITSPELEKELKASLTDIQELVFDFTQLEYISSAGLRVLLATQKIMNKQGSMTVCNVNETVMEVFEVTGFVDLLTIV